MTKILLRSILGVFFHVHYLTPIKLSYSRLVGGLAASLGRSVSTWIHDGTIVGLLSPESAVMLGLGSHFLFRREYSRLETSQPQRRPSSTISLPLIQSVRRNYHRYSF